MKDLVGSRVGHIRIDSLIGKGGMGDVYLGFDEVLERRVALKTIRGRGRLDERTKSRFLREARLLSRLEHPDICQIYDLVEGDDCDFLVLEYIDGRTLAELEVEGLSTAERLEVAIRIADVLATAHGEKIAHRDLKPDNVMVTPAGKVKVLDFGLSRSVLPEAASEMGSPGLPADLDLDGEATQEMDAGDTDGDGDDSRLTREGSLLGTLRFMSPEQARGEAVTEKTDLYSFGILLQELFTGENPYPPRLHRAALLVRVAQGQTNPVEGLESGLAELVEDLESLDPEERPSAEEAARRLRWIAGRPERLRRRRRFVATLAVATALTAAIVAIAFRFLAQPADWVRSPEGRIAILPMVNETDDPSLDWVEGGLPEIVTRALDPLPGIELVPEPQIREALKTLGFPTEDHRAWLPDELDRLRLALGAELVVTSDIVQEKDRFVVHYGVRGLSGSLEGRRVAAPRLTAAGERMAEDLARLFGLGQLGPSPTRDPFARQAYAIGVHLQNTAGYRDARPFFEASLVRDEGFDWARLRLAECLEKLGEWERAIEITDLLVRDDVPGTRDDASLTSAALILIGSIEISRAHYEEARRALERALEIERRSESEAGEARVLFQLAKMHYKRGEYEAALPLFDEALVLLRRAGDRPGELDTLNHIGLVALNRGERDPARQRFEEVRRLAGSYGDRRRVALATVNLGNLAEKDGRDEEAAKLWQEALAGLRSAGDRRNELIVLNNLGVLQLDREDLQAAQTTFSELVALSASLGDRVAEAAASLNLAFARLEAGESEAARAPLARVLELETWVRDHAETYFVRAELAFQEGRFEEAVELVHESRERYGEAWSPARDEIVEIYESRARSERSG